MHFVHILRIAKVGLVNDEVANVLAGHVPQHRIETLMPTCNVWSTIINAGGLFIDKFAVALKDKPSPTTCTFRHLISDRKTLYANRNILRETMHVVV